MQKDTEKRDTAANERDLATQTERTRSRAQKGGRQEEGPSPAAQETHVKATSS